MAEAVYELRTPEEGEPTLCKVVYADNEEFVFALSLQNKTELAQISDDMIREHIDNLLNYLKQYVNNLHMSPAGVYPSEGMPIIHGIDFLKYMEEINNWWTYIEFREEQAQIIYNTAP